MKTLQEKRAKKKAIAEKLSIRQVWKTTTKEKKGATWEFELFKRIALERALSNGCVSAKHIAKPWDTTLTSRVNWAIITWIAVWWEECYKLIALEDLTPTNFSHTIPKSRWEEHRLDPSNIEIVSRAWHHYEHTKQILKVDYPN